MPAKKEITYKLTENGCCICTSHHLNRRGYPMVMMLCEDGKYRPRSMVRKLWTKKYGDIPKGLYILHRCDEPGCINLKHIVLGTPLDNMVDRERKGRTWSGEVCDRKLTAEEAREIYALKGKERRKDIADSYGVSISNVKKIWSGQNWWRETGAIPHKMRRTPSIVEVYNVRNE